ncbi:MAG TPA: ATP-binding cassette domain-containing protein [Acidimicrobiia bacterium]|nr:ATP-binding cassette domain-containing protein [Acidimicrobiia bacterium]
MSVTAEFRAVPPAGSDEAPDLEVQNLTVRFGGLVAVNDVTLTAPGGTITGLIGPNGAGKTTTFNACTGLVTPSAGAIRFGGQDLRHHSPSWRARLGLGRTFQRMELFDTMTVGENVALGREARLAGRRLAGRLFSTRSEWSQSLEAGEAALERCGITHLRKATVGDLSTGQRRLVELARALAAAFRFLLLDEPSSGLDVHETGEFAAILRSVIASDGIGILLVEHDMALVRATCSYTYVLDFGQLIFEGPTADVLASDIVRTAYLGSEGVVAGGGAG